MNTQPYRRLLPGGQLSAAEHNRLLQDVERLAGIKGTGLAVGSNGPKLREPDPWHLWGRVLTAPDDHGQYRCQQLDLTRQDARFTPRNRPGGLVWLPNILPAYEANHNPLVPVGSVVKLRRGVGDFWIFAHCCQELQSGSGAEESGSGSGEGSGSGSGSGAGGSGGGGCDPPPTDTTLYLSFTQTGDTPSFCDCITSPIVMTYNPAGALGPGWYGSTSYFWPCHIAPGFLWSIDAALVNCCGASLCGDSFCELVVNFTGQSCTTISTISCVRARRPLLHTFDFLGSSNCADPCGGGTTWQFTLTE